jgi:hypothetical protein
MEKFNINEDKIGIERPKRSMPDEEVKETKSMANHTTEILQHVEIPVNNPKTSNHDFEISSSSFEGSFGENVNIEEQFKEDEQPEEVTTNKKGFKGVKGPEISLLDLSDKCLQAVYNEEEDELKVQFDILSKLNDNGKSFRYSLTMCFWLSVHLEKTHITQFIYDQDEWLSKLSHYIVESYLKLSELEKRVTQKFRKFKRKQTVDVKIVLRANSGEEDVDLEELVNSRDYKFKNLAMVRKFKHAMRTRAGESLCTNAIKIALITKEEKIASVLLVEYKINVEEDMITRSIFTQKFEFLRYMWLFEKNFIFLRNKVKKIFDYDYLFKKILSI